METDRDTRARRGLGQRKIENAVEDNCKARRDKHGSHKKGLECVGNKLLIHQDMLQKHTIIL